MEAVACEHLQEEEDTASGRCLEAVAVEEERTSSLGDDEKIIEQECGANGSCLFAMRCLVLGWRC